MAAIEVAAVSGALGAEVQGLDLSRPLSDGAFARVREAFHTHSASFISGQAITPELHLAFARRFGPLEVNRFFTPVEGHPEIADVRKEPEQKRHIGERWHTDHSYDEAGLGLGAARPRGARERRRHDVRGHAPGL